LFGSCFNDFGGNFSVLDKNGEELAEIMIKSITLSEDGKVIVSVLDNYKHKFEDSDVIQLKEVNGMVDSEGKSINDIEQIKIRVIDTSSFELLGLDIQKYSKYESGGIAKQVKIPLTVSFKTMQEIDKEADQSQYFDQNLMCADFSKIDNIRILHCLNLVASTNPAFKN
jgi:ubiquitin-activating enzyme E1